MVRALLCSTYVFFFFFWNSIIIYFRNPQNAKLEKVYVSAKEKDTYKISSLLKESIDNIKKLEANLIQYKKEITKLAIKKNVPQNNEITFYKGASIYWLYEVLKENRTVG